MVDLVDNLRRFHSSVTAGSVGSGDFEFAPVLRRFDAFLTSHLGRFVSYFPNVSMLSWKKNSVFFPFA